MRRPFERPEVHRRMPVDALVFEAAAIDALRLVGLFEVAVGRHLPELADALLAVGHRCALKLGVGKLRRLTSY